MPYRNVSSKILLMFGMLALLVTGAQAQSSFSDYYGEEVRPAESNQLDASVLAQVGWKQNLNQQIPLNLTFRDESGKQVALKQFFGNKPVLVEMVYFYCPMLCGEVLKGTFRGLKDVSFRPGRDYQIVVVSINPKEDSALAATKKASYLKEFGMQGEADGIHFLTGQTANIKKLAKAIGFDYTYDPKTDQFAHPAGLVLATPEGRVARYMSGVFFEPKDLRLGLLDAGQGKIGSPLDLILFKCYHYDGQSGQYTLAVMNILRMGGLLTVVLIGLLMAFLVRRDITRTRAQGEEL